MNILTLKVGTRYSSEDVNKLFEQIATNTTRSFEMYCLTEDTQGLLDPIHTIPLWKPEEANKQWHKLRLHDPQQTRIRHQSYYCCFVAHHHSRSVVFDYS